MLLEFFKMHDNVKTPERANPSDAGLDVFYNPPKDENGFYIPHSIKPGSGFLGSDGSICLQPGENAVIRTGLKFGVPHGYVLQVCNRGSMGAKRKLVFGAHIIDPGYDGELMIDLHNIGTEAQIIEPGDKIAQLLLIPCIHFRLKELDTDSLYEYDIAISDRGDGALASTGK